MQHMQIWTIYACSGTGSQLAVLTGEKDIMQCIALKLKRVVKSSLAAEMLSVSDAWNHTSGTLIWS